MKYRVIISSVLLTLSGFAMANAGLPMLFLVAPVYGISIVPIILIESVYLNTRLKSEFKTVLKTVAISNAISTVIGVPVIWFLLVVVQMITGGGSAYGIDTVLGKLIAVTWQAPWILPYDTGSDWIVTFAGLFLLIPFFIVSWWSEYKVSLWLLKKDAPANLKVLIRNANLITYCLLAVWPIGFWLYSL